MPGKVKEIMTGKVPNLARDINLRIQKAEPSSNRKSLKECMSKHITVKHWETKEKKKN